MTLAIKSEALTKRYGPAEVLAPLDLEVHEGEVFGYLGPNGAGKSTTIGLLLGLIRPSGGRAEIFGMDVRSRAAEVHARVAYVPGDANLWPSLTGAEALDFLARVHGRVDATYRTELIERFGLEPDKKVRAYSRGNRQKILLVAAFASRADLLLLDEPTSGLDPLMEQVFQTCVAEAHARGQTVFLSSHILSEVEAVCGRVAMLRAGHVIETGELSVLRGLAAVHIDAEVSGIIPDLASIPGVRAVEIDGARVQCDVTGPIEPVLRMLADAGVERFFSREPSLEEVFISHYGHDEPAAVAATAASAGGRP